MSSTPTLSGCCSFLRIQPPRRVVRLPIVHSPSGSVVVTLTRRSDGASISEDLAMYGYENWSVATRLPHKHYYSDVDFTRAMGPARWAVADGPECYIIQCRLESDHPGAMVTIGGSDTNNCILGAEPCLVWDKEYEMDYPACPVGTAHRHDGDAAAPDSPNRGGVFFFLLDGGYLPATCGVNSVTDEELRAAIVAFREKEGLPPGETWDKVARDAELRHRLRVLLQLRPTTMRPLVDMEGLLIYAESPILAAATEVALKDWQQRGFFPGVTLTTNPDAAKLLVVDMREPRRRNRDLAGMCLHDTSTRLGVIEVHEDYSRPEGTATTYHQGVPMDSTLCAYIIAHEMGHILGVGHSPDPNHMMYPYLPWEPRYPSTQHSGTPLHNRSYADALRSMSWPRPDGGTCAPLVPLARYPPEHEDMDVVPGDEDDFVEEVPAEEDGKNNTLPPEAADGWYFHVDGAASAGPPGVSDV